MMSQCLRGMKFPKVIYSADGFVHFYDNLIYFLNEIDFTILDNEGGFKMLIALFCYHIYKTKSVANNCFKFELLKIATAGLNMLSTLIVTYVFEIALCKLHFVKCTLLNALCKLYSSMLFPSSV